VIKHLLVSDNSEQASDTVQMFLMHILTDILNSKTNFVDVPNSMKILHTTFF
jgi:hypothetical protein